MIRSSIDLGTNTCLLLIADCNSSTGKVEKIISDHARIVRLGQGVDQNRRFLPEAMERTRECLKEYSQIVRKSGADPSQTLAIATSQARDSSNAQEFFGMIEKETGFKFRQITGEEEAQATFLGGLLPEILPMNSAVIDIGGGSTELTAFAEESQKLVGQSLDMGSVRFTERYLKSDPVTDKEFWECQAAIDTEIEKWRSEWKPRVGNRPIQLVAVAGTATSLACLHLGLQRYDREVLDACVLTRGDVHRLVEELKWRTHSERRQMPAMEPQRADVILAGALILWRTLERLGFEACRISTRGLRFGVLQKY